MAGFRFLLPSLLFYTLLGTQFNLNKAQTLVHQFCFDNYLKNSTYSTNVDLLLSSISNYSNGNNRAIYFYNSTVGRSPDRVYGIFQCRGDLTSDDCKKCAKKSTEEIKIKCPNNSDITMWYDECMLRYSYNPIVSAMALDPDKCFSFADNATDPVRFTASLNNLMNGLVSKAVNSTNMFATGEEDVPNSGKVYGLVQCTQDIDKRDCQRCLSTSVNRMPTTCVSGKNGGRLLKPSCIVWFQNYKFFESNGTDFLPASDVDIHPGKDRIYKIIMSILIPTLALLIIILIFSVRKIKRLEITIGTYKTPADDSLQFSIGTILSATGSFSEDNKLGQGGFGSVYKGTLRDGQKIAVKRLAKHSSQGVQEFKNEVLLLAKLQHKFLVRLFGFCLGRDEKLLIYEYVPNRSLDLFIFDSSIDTCLNWGQRYKIIGGVARGLLYLHEDSQHRIIHRDLKASNILLDAEMNPKIADFGIARLFESDQTHGSTNKVVGTYGYMSPEYLIRGQFSAKSDVFSFGVLVLEIITGQKNSNFEGDESSQDLLSYAYRKWGQGTFLEMIDPMLKECYSKNEVMNCIHMGLLCVQDDVTKRPTMETVVLMLNSYSITLPVPSTPAFFPNSRTDFKGIMVKESESTTAENKHLVPDKYIGGSIDDKSITGMYPR